MGDRVEKRDYVAREFTPIKKYSFPAGNCGGTINVTIPAFATREEVETAAALLAVIAEKWTDKE